MLNWTSVVSLTFIASYKETTTQLLFSYQSNVFVPDLTLLYTLK